MSPKLILILLPLVHCKLHVNVKASTKQEELGVVVEGEDTAIISDVERATFQITDAKLKDAVKALSGERPEDVYVRRPTPWNDLYEVYGWGEVKRTITGTAKILGVTSDIFVVARDVLWNNSTIPGTYTASLKREIENTVSNTWTTNNELSVEQSVSYGVNFGISLSGTTGFDFTHGWGEEKTESQTVTVGTKSGVSMELQPGQRVMVTLTASRGYIEIQVNYVGKLSGQVACNYPEQHEGHHFWGYDVNKILAAAGLPEEVTSVELLNIEFFGEGRIVTTDMETQAVIMDEPVPLIARD